MPHWHITVWDAASGEPRQILSEHTQFVSSASFSSDGLTLASGNGRNIDLWDVATGTHQNTLKVGERVASGMYFYTPTADDFSATGKMLIRK